MYLKFFENIFIFLIKKKICTNEHYLCLGSNILFFLFKKKMFIKQYLFCECPPSSFLYIIYNVLLVSVGLFGMSKFYLLVQVTILVIWYVSLANHRLIGRHYKKKLKKKSWQCNIVMKFSSFVIILSQNLLIL